tara:strand:- start:82 stop:2151 length:2070 start_codon:yes stop_codon:yes gene_type:complete
MLNRNNIFKRVRDTTNTLNVSTNRRIDNVYTELMEYENMAQKRYDKIKNILETIRYHHNKIQNLNKNYQGAIFGGATDSSLLDKIETAIKNVDILSKELKTSEFDTIIDIKIKALISKFDKNTNLKPEDVNTALSNFILKPENVTETDVEFFKPLESELSNLKSKLTDNTKNIDNILGKIEAVVSPLEKYLIDKKISREFREPIKTGFTKIEEAVSIDKKTDSEKLSTYSVFIKTGLGYAETDKKLNEKSDKNIDQKILKEFLKSPTNVKFFIQSAGTSGEIKLKNTIINFKFSEIDEKTEPATTGPAKTEPATTGIATLENSDLNLRFKIDIKKLNIGSLYDPVTGKMLFGSFMDVFGKPEYHTFFDKLVKNLKEIFKNKVSGVEDSEASSNKQNRILDEFQKLSNSNFIVPVKRDDISADVVKRLQYIVKSENSTGGKPDTSLTEDPIVIKFKEVLNTMKKRILTEMEQTDNGKIPNKDNKASVGTGASGKTFTTEASVITNSIISSIIENYEKERKLISSVEDKIKLDSKFVDNLDNLGLNLADIFKVNFNDKLAFIFFILVLHIVVYSLIESLIMNSYISDIVYIMATYVGIYCIIMFILLLILNKYVNYRMKTLLNYLNTDFNLQLISMHIFIVFMFYIIVLILSQHIDIFVAKDEDDKLQVLYRIEVISSVIFIFSSVFVMLL